MKAIVVLSVLSFVGVLALLAALARLLAPDFLAAGTNTRSNHRAPARQIGGLAIIPVSIVSLLAVAFVDPGSARACAAIGASMAMLMALGFIDDARDLRAMPKLGIQLAAAAIALWGAAPSPGLFHLGLPQPVELALLFIVLVWFVNLTNFMDGLDLMAVSGLGVPLLIAAGLLVGLGSTAGWAVALATATGAGFAAFAIFNRPPAKLFLGDNGSLPAGLAAGIVFLALAEQISVWGAWIPFGYFIVDATSTVVLRLVRGRNVFQAHSEHAYQIAFRAGRSVPWICVRVIAATLAATAVLLVGTILGWSPAVPFVAGLAIHALLCASFRRQRPKGQ